MKKTMIFLAVLLSVVLLTGSVSAKGAQSGTDEVQLVSPALSVLAEQTGMAMSAPVGNPVQFTKDDFLRAANLSDFTYLVITSAPSEKEGKLLVGSTTVEAGQRISAANIEQLSFSGAKNSIGGSFGFAVDGGAYSYTCRVRFTRTVNYAPTLRGAPKLELAVSTYTGLFTEGTLWAYDPEGDALTYRIVTPPKHGSVILTDVRGGTYEYQPKNGYTGTDSFSYAVFDKYGNWSPSGEVTVTVTGQKTSLAYSDVEKGALYNAVLTMTECGIMSGEAVGGKQYFRPDEKITRAEFVVAMLHAAGISDVPDAKNTPFADDAEIENAMKGYLTAAYSLGYITGSVSGGKCYFRPDDEITRAEAAVLISRMTGLSGGTVAVFADSGSIPTWAKDAVYCLYREGFMTAVDGKIASTASLNRADAAVLLERLARYLGTC